MNGFWTFGIALAWLAIMASGWLGLQQLRPTKTKKQQKEL